MLSPVYSAGQPLKFGVVPQFDARRIQTIWRPILQRLEARTGQRIELVASPGIPEFEKQLLAGDFDLAYMNPYHLLRALDTQGYKPLVRDVGRKLYGIVVVRADSPLQTVKDLNGKTIAFPSPNALGAALIPRSEFGETHGITIKPLYVRTHSSVYLNVVTGQTVAGGGVQKTLAKQPASVRDALKVIYKTPKVASHPVAVHSRVEKAVVDKLRQALLQLSDTPEGRELIAGIPMKQMGEAVLEDYQPLKAMGLDKYYIK